VSDTTDSPIDRASAVADAPIEIPGLAGKHAVVRQMTQAPLRKDDE
jgi:hypothetical protein